MSKRLKITLIGFTLFFLGAVIVLEIDQQSQMAEFSTEQRESIKQLREALRWLKYGDSIQLKDGQSLKVIDHHRDSGFILVQDEAGQRREIPYNHTSYDIENWREIERVRKLPPPPPPDDPSPIAIGIFFAILIGLVIMAWRPWRWKCPLCGDRKCQIFDGIQRCDHCHYINY